MNKRNFRILEKANEESFSDSGLRDAFKYIEDVELLASTKFMSFYDFQ